MDSFLLDTIDPTKFYIEDVINDNSCFYRAISNSINYSTESTKLNDIKMLKTYGKLKDISLVLQNPEWGYDGKKQEKLARFLQKKSYEWVKNNYMNYLDEYDMDIGTMILLTHEIDIDEYLDRYKYFAGDDIITKISFNNKNSEKEYELEDRWGGTPEQIALSEIYHVPIIILTSQKYDVKKDKIITGKIRNNKPEKNVRFKLIQIIGTEFLCHKPPIFVLWKKTNNLGHYMSLYPKSLDNAIF